MRATGSGRAAIDVPLRVRLAAVFALATAAVIGIGGLVFVHLLSNGLQSSVDSTLKTRAADIAAAVSQPDVQPHGFLEAGRHTSVPLGASEAQIVDAGGRVISTTSSTQAGRRPMVDRSVLDRARHRTVRFSSSGADPQRFIVSPVTHAGRPLTIVVRSSTESADEAVDRVERQLFFAGAPGVVLAGVAGWLLAGAALKPVERMRRQVADLGEEDLGPALDVPRTRDEIAALARTMNDLLGRVRRARYRERGFVAEASHELRTPLAILRGELELAGRPGRTPEELRAALGVAAVEAERLTRLSEDLLLLARSDEGGLPVEPRPTELAALVGQSISASLTRADDLGVELRVDDRGVGAVPIDPDRFRQAIDNLLDNALRHAPPGSTITIRLERTDGEARCVVLDEGEGFPPGFAAHAMERFSKGDGKEDASGAGLGLAIVRTIAEAHGGRAWVDNRTEGGAEAGLSFPLPDGAGPGAVADARQRAM